jgi:hypothetical protein
MANKPTSFIWYELMTSDTEAGKAFYREVVGWQTKAFEGGDDYTILEADGRGVGGVMKVPDEARERGARPCWLGYIAVDDVDAAAARVTEAGGTLHKDMMDIPNVGRIAMMSDPQGAPFYLIAPDGEDQPPAPPMTPGHVGWHELHTSDWEASFDFYSRQFGWAKADAMDMGPMGTYQLFTAGDDNWIGGMFNAATFGRPGWLFYFVVADVDAAAERVGAAGGQVLNGPMEVPGGAWIIQCRDPQGAMFALVGMRS